MLVNVISQVVTTSLKVSSQPAKKVGAGTNGTGYTSKPYLGKSQPSQLAPGADGSLNPDLEHQYCTDTGHLKGNYIKLNHWLAQEQKTSDPNSTTSNTCASNLANYRLLCPWTRAGEQPRVVQKILPELTMFQGHYPTTTF